jgi:TRAP-type C4-dicarboxylate transport system permease small subunit
MADDMIGLTDIFHKIVKWMAAFALLIMMVLTFTDVNLRYWLGQPILGSNEMTEFLLGIIVFTGLVIVSGERSHIVVTLFEPILLRKIPNLYKWLGLTTNLLGIIAVTFIITNYTFFMHTQGNETEIREWEWWWLGTVMSVLCGFAILMSIRSIRSPLPGIVEDDTGAGDEKPNLGGHSVGGT